MVIFEFFQSPRVMRLTRISRCAFVCYFLITLLPLALAHEGGGSMDDFQPFGNEPSSPNESKAEICGFPTDRSEPQGECYMLVPQKFNGEPHMLHEVHSLSDIFPIWHPGISSLPLRALGSEVDAKFSSEPRDQLFVDERTRGTRYLSLLNIELIVKSRTQPENQRQLWTPLAWWEQPKLPVEISLVMSIEGDEAYFSVPRELHVRMQLVQPGSNVYEVKDPAAAYDEFVNLFDLAQSHDPRRLRFERIEGFISEYYSEELISNLKKYVKEVGSVLTLDAARYVIRMGSFPVEFGDEELIDYRWRSSYQDANHQIVSTPELTSNRSSGFYK